MTYNLKLSPKRQKETTFNDNLRSFITLVIVKA